MHAEDVGHLGGFLLLKGCGLPKELDVLCYPLQVLPCTAHALGTSRIIVMATVMIVCVRVCCMRDAIVCMCVTA